MMGAQLKLALVMSPYHLLSQLIGNHLSPTDLVVTLKLFAIALSPTTGNALCPVCGQSSDRIHSRYRRVIADLPICGRQLVLILRLRKFLCTNAGCPRRIFCERILDLAAAHARSTTRLAQEHRTLGIALGGEPAARLSVKLAMPASGDTILRRVKTTVSQPEPRYRFVGIDDFALRKGQTYGTIVVDLERRRVIDLFEGRDGSVVQMWLSSHPTIEVITRDRWAAYANACSAGASMALQVADRFHLVGNIRELVERLFEQHASALDAALEPPATIASQGEVPPTPASASRSTLPVATGTTATHDATSLPGPASTASSPGLSRGQQLRLDRFNEVRRLHGSGRSTRQIARELRISRNSVLDYLHRERCPDGQRIGHRRSSLEGFRATVDAFVHEGGRSVTMLQRRLKDQGCSPSYDAVWRFLRRRLEAAGIPSMRSVRGPPRPPRLSTRQLSFEFVRRTEKRSDEATKRMVTVNAIPELCASLKLANELLEMTRGQSKTSLSDWLARADASENRSVRMFAETLRTDSSAVQAALSTPWNNGPVEGQVNRLKLIKRSGYGRAGLPLLRARVRAKP
ncbi:MAG: ISL3 family transposase [Planctomycetes bacterium]|nr:ISL3 family transposase [Planctomycetota bacterium]